MSRLLVSACLLGEPVRYDGRAKPLQHQRLAALLAADRVIPFCPEVAGGLPVPRAAAEIVGGDGDAVLDGAARVLTCDGEDVSEFFLRGAQRALHFCRRYEVGVAVLTETSPSCGSGQVYDGSFTRQPLDGSGVTTALLRRHQITVFNQHCLDGALDYYLDRSGLPAPTRPA